MSFDFSPYSAVLLDLDGTLYHDDHALPGAAALVQRIQNEGRPFACLTNSTSSPQRLAARLAGMGIHMPAGNIYTAAAAAADYLLEHFPPRPRVFNLATQGMAEMLEGQVEWTLNADDPCDAVIVGPPIGEFSDAERRRTALYLLRGGARLIGICADRVYPSPRGLEFGSGAMTAMLAYAANVAPVYTGKPEPVFFNELCRRLGVEPARCILIGDNLESDIAGAANVGMAAILTLTGITTRSELAALPEAHRPQRVISDLAAIV